MEFSLFFLSDKLIYERREPSYETVRYEQIILADDGFIYCKAYTNCCNNVMYPHRDIAYFRFLDGNITIIAEAVVC